MHQANRETIHVNTKQTHRENVSVLVSYLDCRPFKINTTEQNRVHMRVVSMSVCEEIRMNKVSKGYFLRQLLPNKEEPICLLVFILMCCLGLPALRGSISVCIGSSPREREKEGRNDGREKNVQTTPIRT